MRAAKFTIRRAKLADAKELLATIREILKTSKWVLSEPDEIANSTKRERAFIKTHLDNKNALIIVALSNKKIIGILNTMGSNKRRYKHVVSLGISVAKEWRGKGVGTALMKYVVEWARGHKLKKIKLSVVANNTSAIKLYKKAGFIAEGRSKKEMKINRRYYDTIEMAKFI